jgi:hypothetical protein
MLKSTYHLVASPNKHSDRSRVGTLLDDQHLFPRRSKRNLPDNSSLAQLVRRQVFESRYDSSVGRNGDQLDLWTTDPSDGGKVVLHQQVIGLVVETPLTDDQVGTSVLDPRKRQTVAFASVTCRLYEPVPAFCDSHLDHVQELFSLVLSELLVLLHALDIQLVLGLGPWRLKRTRQNGDLGILHRSGHLRV